MRSFEGPDRIAPRQGFDRVAPLRTGPHAASSSLPRGGRFTRRTRRSRAGPLLEGGPADPWSLCSVIVPTWAEFHPLLGWSDCAVPIYPGTMSQSTGWDSSYPQASLHLAVVAQEELARPPRRYRQVNLAPLQGEDERSEVLAWKPCLGAWCWLGYLAGHSA